MNTQPTDAMRANKAWPIVCGLLLIGSVSAEAGRMDTVSSGASDVWQGVKKKANDAWIGVTDSKAGKFISPSERNKRDRERILSVLSFNDTIVRKSDGTIRVINQDKLDKYYASLQSSKALSNVYGFSPADDPKGTKSGQFWQNFFDGKDHNLGDAPASMDPFATHGRGLATAMHTELAAATGTGNNPDLADYADAAASLKVRGIDILEKDLRQGVAAGADTYIKALDAITGGTSSQAVKWMEDAAKVAKETADDPTGAAKDYLKEKINGEMADKAANALKSALGEDRYDSLMEKYEGYGDKQEKIQKIMEDLARVTGDKRLEDAAKKMKEFSPDAITDGLIQKVLPPGLRDEKEGEDGAAGEDEGKEKDGGGGDIDKPATGDKDPLDPEPTLEKEPESETPPEAPAEPDEDESGEGESDADELDEGETDEGEGGDDKSDPDNSGEGEAEEGESDEGESDEGESDEDKPESDKSGDDTADDGESDAEESGDGESEENESGEDEPVAGADEGQPDGASSDSGKDPDSGGAPGDTTTGYVENSEGRITVTETRGPDGSLTRVTETETDKAGNVKGTTTYEGGTGEGKYTKYTPAGDGLKGAEPPPDGEVSPETVSGGVNTSGAFAQNWSQSQNQRGADGSMTMAQNTQMGEAANAGNQIIRDASTVRDGGGRDSQSIRDAAARATAKSDRDNSWGKAIGNAVESGITEGGKAFGAALGGSAADVVVGEIFGSDKDASDGGDGGKNVVSSAAPPPPPASGAAPAKDKKPPTKTDGGSGASAQSDPSGGGDGETSSPASSSPDDSQTASSTPGASGGASSGFIGHCPRCGRTDLVEHVVETPTMDIHDWRCPACNVTGRSGPPPSGLGSDTAPPSTESSTAPPPPKKTRSGCPFCKATVAFRNDNFELGPIYQCANGHVAKQRDLITVEE
ncbi:MAG: hypothetical protein EOM72_01215 [Opitutae bacterium]|nr:hypothetical protein [Opitutae bacterium]